MTVPTCFIMEIIANFENQPFLDAVRAGNLNDIVHEKYGDLKIVLIAENEEVEYEERLSPTVLYRRKFRDGKLLKKLGTTTFIFVPNEYLL